MSKQKRMTFIAMLVAIGVILNVVESLILIPSPVPGMKLGIANIVGLITLYTLGIKAFISVNSLRVLIASVLAGYFLSYQFFMSISGLVLSSLVMILVFRFFNFSIFGVSVIGAYFHIIGQFLMAILLYQTTVFIFYIPYLLLLSLFSGYFVALAASFIIKRMRKHDFFNF